MYNLICDKDPDTNCLVPRGIISEGELPAMRGRREPKKAWCGPGQMSTAVALIGKVAVQQSVQSSAVQMGENFTTTSLQLAARQQLTPRLSVAAAIGYEHASYKRVGRGSAWPSESCRSRKCCGWANWRSMSLP